jgi:hypothetical protein
MWIHLLMKFLGLRPKHVTLLHAVRRLWVALRRCYQAWTKTHGQFHKIVPCVRLNGGWSKASVCMCVSACAHWWGIQNISSRWVHCTSRIWRVKHLFYDFRLTPRYTVQEIFALLGYYAAYSGNSLPTFRLIDTDGLLRNIDEELPLDAAWCHSRARVLKNLLQHWSKDW